MDFIFGLHPVLEALREDKNISKIFVSEGLHGEAEKTIRKASSDKKIALQRVPKFKLDKICKKNHQGVIAYLSPVEFQNLEETIMQVLEEGENPIVLVLDRVQDIGNIGAILRSAECFSVGAVVIGQKGSGLISPDLVKSSAGALFRIPLCRNLNIQKSIEFLKMSGFSIVGATEKSNTNLSQLNQNGPIALIMGNEEKGIANETLKLCDHLVKIPMSGSTQSLNVSVAAGIMLYSIRELNKRS